MQRSLEPIVQNQGVVVNQTETVIKLKKRPAKLKLTKLSIKALPVPAAEADGKATQLWTYDSKVPRLAICTWSSGAKTWYWVGRLLHSRRMMRYKLGDANEVTPEQAAKLAARISAQVVEGVDPRTEKNAAKSATTFGDLFARYMDEHAKPKKKESSWTEDQRIYDRYLTQWKALPLDAITRDTLYALHAKVGRKAKTQANRLVALVSKCFSHAITRCSYKGSNPATKFEKFKEKSRDRFLSGDELQKFFAALGKESQMIQDFFSVLLLIGARRGNVQAMRFEELDLAQHTWRIPMTKTGEPLRVHLVDKVVEILTRRQADSEGNPWVFPAGKRNQAAGFLQDPHCAWKRILKRCGLKDVRMHDLRRTCGSWQAAAGASLPMIGRQLGHTQPSTTAIYARLNLDPVRAAVDRAAVAMLAAAAAPKEKEGGE